MLFQTLKTSMFCSPQPQKYHHCSLQLLLKTFKVLSADECLSTYGSFTNVLNEILTLRTVIVLHENLECHWLDPHFTGVKWVVALSHINKVSFLCHHSACCHMIRTTKHNPLSDFTIFVIEWLLQKHHSHSYWRCWTAGEFVEFMVLTIKHELNVRHIIYGKVVIMYTSAIANKGHLDSP